MSTPGRESDSASLATAIEPRQAKGPSLPWAVTILLVAAAAAWSTATADYRFGIGDDGWQAPIVLHEMDPTLLRRDPLITEVSKYYQSGLFPLLAVVARRLGLAETYAVFFVLNRVLMMAAYFYLTLVCTGSRAIGVLSVFLLTGFGYYGFGTYLGGTPILEEKLVPRAFALPFALAALAAMIAGRQLESALWTLVTLILHPVTGASAIGIYLVYGVLSYRTINQRRFGIGVVLVAAAAGIGLWLVRPASGGLWIDPDWRRIIDRWVGEYVFIARDTAWRPWLFPTAIVFFGVAVACIGSRDFFSIAIKLATAAALAMATHWLGVDRLGFHPLLEACPERATYAVTALAGTALAALIVKASSGANAITRLPVGLLTAAIFLRLDYRLTALFLLASVLVMAPRPYQAVAWLGLITLGLSLLVVKSPSLRGDVFTNPYMLPRFDGLARLGALGVEDREQLAVENWLREHTEPDEVIMPPLGNARGWQIFSHRATLFNLTMYTYTHFSKDLAERYEAYFHQAQSLFQGSWSDLEKYAAGQGASWIITDEPYRRAHPDTPAGDFTSGPYRVIRIPSAAGAIR
jgi:hypothetical protein